MLRNISFWRAASSVGGSVKLAAHPRVKLAKAGSPRSERLLMITVPVKHLNAYQAAENSSSASAIPSTPSARQLAQRQAEAQARTQAEPQDRTMLTPAAPRSRNVKAQGNAPIGAFDELTRSAVDAQIGGADDALQTVVSAVNQFGKLPLSERRAFLNALDPSLRSLVFSCHAMIDYSPQGSHGAPLARMALDADVVKHFHAPGSRLNPKQALETAGLRGVNDLAKFAVLTRELAKNAQKLRELAGQQNVEMPMTKAYLEARRDFEGNCREFLTKRNDLSESYGTAAEQIGNALNDPAVRAKYSVADIRTLRSLQMDLLGLKAAFNGGDGPIAKVCNFAALALRDPVAGAEALNASREAQRAQVAA